MTENANDWEERPLNVIQGTELKQMLQAAAQHLTNEKERVNDLNVFPVPDGDTGTNMALTITAAVKELDALETDSAAKVAAAVARGSLMGARGNSGVILSQFFRGFSDGLKGISQAGGIDIARALTKASQTTYRAVMKPVEGTMLTVGREAAEAAQAAAEDNQSALEVWNAALKVAKKTLADTPKMMPVLREAGVVDAGGDGLVCILEGALAGLKGEVAVETLTVPASAPPEERKEPAAVEREEGITRIDGQLVNHYCTEFLIKGQSFDIEAIRGRLEPEGDSMLVVGDEELVKVHIHTDHPGKVLEYCGTLGELTDIKIDNMKLQNESITTDDKTAEHEEPKGEPKPIGLVAVVPGAGLAEIFESLGVDVVVTGGQTMNPSTEELVAAVEQVHAHHVIVLPNNKNVIFSAQQARELVDFPVRVIPTRSVPQGIGALMKLDPEGSLEDNVSEMEDGMRQVLTGEVTYAVRATRAGDLQIEEEDIIGLVEGKITAAGGSVSEVTLGVLNRMVDEDSSVISLYTGENQDFSEAEQFAEVVTNTFPDCEVELYHGGQPLYYYIVSVE